MSQNTINTTVTHAPAPVSEQAAKPRINRLGVQIDVARLRADIKELETSIRADKTDLKERQRAFSAKWPGKGQDYNRRAQAQLKAKENAGITKEKLKINWSEIDGPPSIEAYLTDERQSLTLLYCVLAHMHGKLHMTQHWVKQTIKGTKDDNGKRLTPDADVLVLTPVTMEDQAKMIKPALADYQTHG